MFDAKAGLFSMFLNERTLYFRCRTFLVEFRIYFGAGNEEILDFEIGFWSTKKAIIMAVTELT